MYTDKWLKLFPTPKHSGPTEPLFKTFLFTRSCSVPRLWSCLCLCHKFDVLCGGGGKKCSCWTAAETNAGKFPLENADGHWGENCECQKRARAWANKNSAVWEPSTPIRPAPPNKRHLGPWTSITNSML